MVVEGLKQLEQTALGPCSTMTINHANYPILNSRRVTLSDTGRNFFNLCNLFIYLGFYITFNTVQVISRRVVGRAEETSTYSSLGFCTVNCRPTASNYQLSHLRLCGYRTPASEVGGESVTTLPPWPLFYLCKVKISDV